MPMKVRYTVVDGEVIAEKRAGVRKCYVPDPLGSTIALVDSSQTITDTFSYWPYGEIKSRTGTTATPFQFVGTLGYYTDSSTRNYVRARHLRKDLTRWQTEDPIGYLGGDRNLHRYVGGGVATWIDPSGLFDERWCRGVCILVGIAAPELLAECVSLCSSCSDLDELRKILNRLCDKKKRGKCMHPNGPMDCINCPGSGGIFVSNCKQCCDNLDDDGTVRSPAYKCRELCDYWGRKKKPPVRGRRTSTVGLLNVTWAHGERADQTPGGSGDCKCATGVGASTPLAPIRATIMRPR